MTSMSTLPDIESRLDDLASLAHELARLREELTDVSKARAAMQEMVDALAMMTGLDQFIPVALRIVARAFASENCSYFEHRGDDPVRLVHRFLEGRVLSREEFLQIYGDDPEYTDALLNGFTVEDSYFGMPFRERIRPNIVDHADPARTSGLDLHCRARGWTLELNVPLMIGGRAEGALVIERGPGSAYTAGEVALAERLGQQLALAMEVSRLTREAGRATMAREKERAAEMRVEEVTRFSRALRTTLDPLVSEVDFLSFVGCLMQNACEHMQATVAEYWQMEGKYISKLILTCRDGRIFNGSDIEHDIRPGGVKVRPEVIGANSVEEMATYFVCDDLRNDPYVELMFDSTGFSVRQWCEERDVYKVIGLPLRRENRAFGLLNIFLPRHPDLSQARIDLALSFAQQLAVSVRLAEFAEGSKQAAVLREREIAAQGRAEEISRFSEALRKTLDSLVDGSDFPGFTGDLLRVTSEQLQAPVVEYWKDIDDETAALSLTCRDGVIFEGSDVKDDVRVRGIKPSSDIINSPTLRQRTTHFIMDDLANDPRQKALFEGTSLDMSKWCRERGVHRHLNLPLVREGRHFGALAVYLPRNLMFDQAKIDVAYSFAQQLALSIRLTELAEESKQVAVSREREQATQERAAEFAKANSVLRSTLDQLAANRDLHSFPRTILNEAIKQLGGSAGVIFRLCAETRMLEVAELIAPASSPADVSEVMALAIPIDSVSSWQELVTHREAVVFDVELDGEQLLPGAQEWLKRQGNKSVIAAPLFLESEPYGYFSIALRDSAADVSKVSLGLVQALTQQANLAIQLTRMAENSQQSAVAVERQRVVIQERAHMAREIHDKLAQGYAAILMQQHAMRRTLKQEPAAMRLNSKALIEHLDIIEGLSKDNLADARKTMDELRLDPLGPSDLELSLEACVAQINGRSGFEVKLELHGDVPLVPHYMETEVCRVVGEAIANARKHSRAKSATVTVQKVDEKFSILIHDNGIGFDVQAVTSSFGIASMYERAARAGAELAINSAPGYGTQVSLLLGIN